MQLLLFLAAVGSATGCATPRRQSDAELRKAAEALEAAAQESEKQMSPDQREAFHSQVEQNVVAEMRAAAVACGTDLRFSEEPKFEDRSVVVDGSATPDQLACVQKSYPFVKASPK